MVIVQRYSCATFFAVVKRNATSSHRDIPPLSSIIEGKTAVVRPVMTQVE